MRCLVQVNGMISVSSYLYGRMWKYVSEVAGMLASSMAIITQTISTIPPAHGAWRKLLPRCDRIWLRFTLPNFVNIDIRKICYWG